MNEDAIVSPEWLAEHRDDPDVVVVDVRDAWEYDGIGHVPGAVNVPYDAIRAEEHAAEGAEDGADESASESVESGRAGMLPGADTFATLMGEAGITREDTVVAYDDHHGVFAARLLVTALLYGHPPEHLRLLDGDYSAWTREHPASTETPDVAATTYEVTDPEHDPLVDIEAVEEAVDDPDVVVVDTRSPEEYAEGHIPGAVNFDWREVVDEETRGLRPADVVRDVLAEKGIVPEKRVVLYCNTARRISHTYVVLRHLGYEDVDFYEGSLTEWKREGRPLVSE
ncbi:sulfurtransferase [Halospeciosus flavus]|uniref:Sulfurtransferase n=1 Tax=Halospeciosus flavus TaxID=3032283 RepID=A0ABD5Z7N3_9EURY|nr:rhodanese-like domain-containing protein [Halospeciosus flavus]